MSDFEEVFASISQGQNKKPDWPLGFVAYERKSEQNRKKTNHGRKIDFRFFCDTKLNYRNLAVVAMVVANSFHPETH